MTFPFPRLRKTLGCRHRSGRLSATDRYSPSGNRGANRIATWSVVRFLGTLLLVGFLCVGGPLRNIAAQEFEPNPDVAAQPLKAQSKRIVDALEYLGQPVSAEDKAKLQNAWKMEDEIASVKAIQAVLDRYAIAQVHINPESRVKVAAGSAGALVEHGWTVFLVKVLNEAGITPALQVSSPNAAPVYRASSGSPLPQNPIEADAQQARWMDVSMFDDQPLMPKLSGLLVEYRVLQIYSRDRGQREATLAFNVGQGTQDLGFRNEVAVLFDCQPAVNVTLRVSDDDGAPTMGRFIFRDQLGRVYPARSRRLAPDFFFHDQVYREDGESVLLPPGDYHVTYTRGPEYRVLEKTITVPVAETYEASFQLERWIKLADHRWFSGDHHVHAAGCAHYETPTEGVTPADMMRHIMGEDLNVGCVLSWGPCWYYQKQFFEGKLHELSTPEYLMRYDVEVSGFPSSHAGHLCLLNLQEDDFEYTSPREFEWAFGPERGAFRGTKTEKIGEWPSWDLPVLKWGKSQGGIVGFSHSGWGLEVPGNELPNYNLPPFDGIGANEYIVDVCHDAVDFISTVDTPAVWELNIWYHTLNCGYTCRISGETDFPCIYGERVGLGRVYVKLDENEPLEYSQWIQGIKAGRSYVSDGLSHLVDFQVNGLEVGTPAADGRVSTLGIAAGEELRIDVKAAALLGERPDERIRRRSLNEKPYWHVERARLGESRRVPVELIVNGQVVETTELEADGDLKSLNFKYRPERSSWVAVRIFPSSHTNPIFVEVDDQPIRASRRSAEWCLKAVEKCWQSKQANTYDRDRDEAKAAYDFAKREYQTIIAESYDDRRE